MPDLEQRLAAERDALVSAIKTPDIQALRVRATARRRRRRVAIAASAAACALAVVAMVGLPDRGPAKPEPAATTPPPVIQPTWSGGGITLLGLPATATDLPGQVYDVEFVDGQHGYALSSDCKDGSCRLGFAVTADSGLTWKVRTDSLPMYATAPAFRPDLVPVGPNGLILTGMQPEFSSDGGLTWRLVPDGRPSVARLPKDARPYVDSGKLDAWLPDGARATLAKQPALTVYWVADTPSADGSWWAGGRTADGHPAAAVTHDQGASWTVTPFDGPAGSWAEVAVLGGYAYATVVTGQPRQTVTVHELLRSTDAGKTFVPFGNPQALGKLAGDLIPLLDGRLLAASPSFRVSDPYVDTFTDLYPRLPWVAQIRRTGGGWVAYDLFAGGWVAFTPDGTIWHKLTVA